MTDKPKILIADKIHADAINEAKEFADVICDFEITPENLLTKIKEYDAVIVRSRSKITKDIIEASEGNLKAIARAGVGLDNIDLETAKEKNIPVFNAPESLTISVAEHTIGLMLAIARNTHHADRTMKQGQWNKKQYVGMELYGKTLGVIGFGRIGREVADRAYAFGMNVTAYDPFITIEDARESNAKLVELDELLQNSDFISLHMPATDETKGMINTEKLALMKPTAYLINTARGSIIDEQALTNALKEKKIAGAALDVFANEPPGETELTKLDNILLTPHLGSGTKDAQRTAGTIVAEKLKQHFAK